MLSDTSTILRKEIKYIIPFDKLNIFYHWLNSKKNILPIHETRLVHSIYFDDIYFKAATDNLSGIENREKFRIRWYGEHQDAKVNFEVKKKIYLHTAKLTFNTNFLYSTIDIYNFLSLNSPLTSLLKEKMLKLIGKNYLTPTLQTTYLRSYYSFSDIRLTFDKSLSYKSFQTNDVKKDTDCILEVKFHDKDQENVRDLLDNFEFVISRHSKYLKGLYYFDVINYL
jgi:SPX domain protein involved in polyphosphate accumulation